MGKLKNDIQIAFFWQNLTVLYSLPRSYEAAGRDPKAMGVRTKEREKSNQECRDRGRKVCFIVTFSNPLWRAYAEQTLTMNRMRGMLEDEMTQKRAEKLKQMQEENKRLALEKKQRENKWRQEQEHMNQKEIADPNFSWRI